MFHNTTATLNLRLQKLITAIGLLLVLVTFALPDAALAQTVTRGPYLQIGSSRQYRCPLADGHRNRERSALRVKSGSVEFHWPRLQAPPRSTR